MINKKNVLNRVKGFSILASMGIVALICWGSTASAATAPSLPNAGSFGVLGATAISNTGPTVIIGDLGIDPNNLSSVTGFTFSTSPGPGQVIGATHFADGPANLAQTDAGNAFTSLNQPCNTSYGGGQDLGGLSLVPGVYCSASSFNLTGTLTLDAGGDPNAVWIFIMPASTITTAADSVVKVINGGQACNVFWRVGSSATLNARTTFIGTIIAEQSITMVGGGVNLSGRALALNAAVTLDNDAISVCSLALPPPPGTPTVAKAFNPIAINIGGVSTLTITLSNPNPGATTITSLTDNLPTNVVIAGTPNASTTCGGTLTANVSASTVTLTGGSIPGGIPGACIVKVDVTSPTAGSWINTLAAGDLVTSNGPNAAPAIATLTVNPASGAPTVAKGFFPAAINKGANSVLKITLSNPNALATTITSFTDNLPPGVFVSNSPNVINSCGGIITATPGSSTVTLTGGAISGGSPGTCLLQVNVTSSTAGIYVNTILAGSLVTTNGTNAAPAVASLTVNPFSTGGGPVAVPTLNEWGAILFMLLAGLGSVYYLRKHRRV